MKTYDYINRVVITLPLTMILRVRRNFFEISMFPNSWFEARQKEMFDADSLN